MKLAPTVASLILVLAGLSQLIPGAAEPPGEGCDPSGSPKEGVTTRLNGQEPRYAFENETVPIPEVVVEQTNETVTGVRAQLVRVDQNNTVPVTDRPSETFQDSNRVDFSFNISGPTLFRQDAGSQNPVEVLVCVSGKPAHNANNESLRWNITKLDRYNLSKEDVTHTDRPKAGLAPPEHLVTTASNLSVTLLRANATTNLGPYLDHEQEGALGLVTSVETTNRCPKGTPNLDSIPSTTITSDGAGTGWRTDGTIKQDINLDQFPACKITLTFSLQLERCALENDSDGCSVSNQVEIVRMVHRPWTVPPSGPVQGSPLPKTLWAPQIKEMAELQQVMDSFKGVRTETLTNYSNLGKPGTTDASRIENLHNSYLSHVSSVRNQLDILRGQPGENVTGLSELETAFNTTVEKDETSIRTNLKEYTTAVRDAAGSHWSTVREDFLLGFGPALLVSGIAIAGLTIRWRKKTRYWSMFSSKASFTHPLRVALILATVAVAGALLWGFIDGDFSFSRLIGLGVMEGGVTWI